MTEDEVVDRHLGSFQFLAIMSKCCYEHPMSKFLCRHMFAFLLGRYLGVEQLGGMVTLWLSF